MKVIYYGHDLHFLRLGREYELTGDINIKREADYWKSVELTMMHKAAVSYYPSYVEINAIHAIDGSIPQRPLRLMSMTPSWTTYRMTFAKREGLLFVAVSPIRPMRMRCCGLPERYSLLIRKRNCRM